jgi:hypothetical protein
MNNDFNTGRPPMWRLIFYALVVMAIPIYFFYPHFNELSLGLKLVSVVLLVSSVLSVFFVGVIMPLIKNNNISWIKEHNGIIRIVLIIILLLIGVLKLVDIFYK